MTKHLNKQFPRSSQVRSGRLRNKSLLIESETYSLCELPLAVQRIIVAVLQALELSRCTLAHVAQKTIARPPPDRLTFFLKHTDAPLRQLVAALNDWNDNAPTLACDELQAQIGGELQQWATEVLFLGRHVGRPEEATAAIKACFDMISEPVVVS